MADALLTLAHGMSAASVIHVIETLMPIGAVVVLGMAYYPGRPVRHI